MVVVLEIDSTSYLVEVSLSNLNIVYFGIRSLVRQIRWIGSKVIFQTSDLQLIITNILCLTTDSRFSVVSLNFSGDISEIE